MCIRDRDKAFRVHVTNNRISHKERGSVRYAFHDIIGSSKQLRMTLNRAMRAAGSSAPVFLEGETGTGKELFAQSIHSGGTVSYTHLDVYKRQEQRTVRIF